MDKKRRGLGALIPNVAWRGREEPVSELAPEAILPNPYQPRQQAETNVAELVESIRVHGIVQPLVVRPQGDRYELVAGQRRLAAARQAGLSQVPVIIRQCTDREMLELALVENLQREDLNPMEAAAAYHKLATEFALSQEQVAEAVGKSRSAVANTMRLLNLPQVVQDSLRAGEITEGHGRAILAADSHEAMLALWQVVRERSLSVREAETLGRPPARPARARKPSRTPAADPNLADLERQLRETLGTKATIRPHRRGSGGTIELEYYSADDLERVLACLLNTPL